MVSDLKFFAKNCVYLPRRKKFFHRFFSSHLFTPFNGPFAHTSWSPMSKIFRYLESLGKSNGKKWSQIWTFFLKNCVKMTWKKSFLRIFVICSLRLKVFLPPLPEVQCPILFWFSESLGKSNGKKWSQIVKLLLIKGLHLPRKKSCFFWQIVFFKNLSLFCFMVIYHISPLTSHLSPVTCHLSPVTCHLSPVTCHLSPWLNKIYQNKKIKQLSLVTCHMSPVTCHLALKPTATATDPPLLPSSYAH